MKRAFDLITSVTGLIVITDPASIEFRHEEDILAQSLDPDRTYAEKILPRKLDLYEQYTREHSMTGDLWIILRTIKEIVK